jgi:hypothetical protein
MSDRARDRHGATSASGLWEGINDEAVTVKHLHPGSAAERGVRSRSSHGWVFDPRAVRSKATRDSSPHWRARRARAERSASTRDDLTAFS